MELHKQIITSNQQIAPNTYILSFKRDFIFAPGQWIAISLHLNDTPRLYSIASGISNDEIMILFDIKAGGELTPNMATLKKGDEIFISNPQGSFFGKSGKGWWIATGTGIAPFKAMLDSGLGKDKKLLHGGRTLDSFYFENQFSEALGENYIRCCTREKGDNVFEGRITEYLKKQNQLPPDEKYYLCGSSEMVVETRDILVDKGVPYENIKAEIYF
ncbi:MAG: FAD-binding oxidoreductase [Bacteroidetes bacterium]|nr:FAD-binding oxidoreductase [Bacteroidota bacterium]